MKLRDSPFVHVGAELLQDNDSLVKLAHEEFAQNPQPLPTSSGLWAARRKILSPEDIKLRRRKLGELRWSATVSRPDICVRPAWIPALGKSLQGCESYCINDLVRTVKVWEQAAIMKYSFSSNPEAPEFGDVDSRRRRRRKRCILEQFPSAAVGRCFQ